MPNKPHPPRKPGKKPTGTAATANGEDTSYIQFANSKDDKKKKNAGSNNPPPTAESSKSTKSKNGAPAAEANAADAPKGPSTRTLISGSASWTGKLPLNLFNEHCQKQKWEKPEYTMNRSSNPPGFISSVIVRNKNPKTQELTTLPPIALPRDKQAIGVRETAVEARHFAATYALFRVANMKNLHMTLPPQFRDLWKGEFADMKKEAVEQGQGWMYEADPFAAREKREEEKRIMEKKRAEKDKRIEAEKKLDTGLGVPKGKMWSRAPKVEMGKNMRRDVEDVIRKNTIWNPRGTVIKGTEVNKIVAEVSALGFRKAHVEEATTICKDKEEVLEWLLIHVPEDDLPKWALPEGYSAGVSLASGDLQREGKIKRLAAAGYSPDLCADVLDDNNGDELRAAEVLQNDLRAQSNITTPSTPDDSIDDREFWTDEQTVLESIFGDRFKKTADTCRVMLEIPNHKGDTVTAFIRRPTKGYPHSLPILSIEANLPSYIRLSITRRALEVASTDYLGEQMIFNLIDWIENNIAAVIEHPGKLSSLVSAAMGATTEQNVPLSIRQKATMRSPRKVVFEPSPAGERILSEWKARQSTPAQQKMNQVRQNLPAWNLRDAIVKAVNSSQVTIISGETGSGKSTQSVQFVLDDMIQKVLGAAANIICTQPRRISALGLADRVAEERCGRVGGEVGYIIRGESKQTQGESRITFVTTGVLLRRLQTSGGKPRDVIDALADVSHVVIDEVHERSLDTDFLMVLLRDVLKARKNLKLILMSATLDAEVFERYFASSASVSKIEIAGRTHPVQDLYMDDVLRLTGYTSGFSEHAEGEADDKESSIGAALRSVGTRINYDVIAATVQYIHSELGSQDGGILIFLPGVAEIDRTLRALQGSSHLHALPLHASLQPAEQRRVFPAAPHGKRKVIAATNVAETSITIEDIVAVIDTGRVKETSFDPVSSMVKLEEVWASRAACKQRRGRAGRVRAGICYKLYTRAAEANKMAERPDPEIRRVPLEQLCLSVKAMGVQNVPAFLASALTPPESVAVEGALDLLTRMGALDANELTALGRHLAMIPADLRCGKLLVYGAIFGCLDACLTIAGILSGRSPFVSPQNKREEAKAARAVFSDGNGDLMCDLQAYEQWAARRAEREPTSMTRRWCDENFLSHQTLQDISTNRTQYLSSLQEIGLVPHSYRSNDSSASALNANNESKTLLRALVAASFTPQIARIGFPDTKYIASISGAVAQDPEARTIKFFTEDASTSDDRVSRLFIHPSSTLFTAQTFPANSTFMSYFTKMATSKVFMRDLTPFNTYTALLFCGTLELDTRAGGGLLLDRWIRIKGWARIGVLVSRLRAMLDELLAKKVDDPGLDISGSGVVSVVRRLLEFDGLDR
ncbi:hypothetical protein MBLNU457_5963t1 [Dothideomycetes sp. NU457]